MIESVQGQYLESSFHGRFVETREGSSRICCFKLSGGKVGFLSGARLRVRTPVEARKLIVQVASEEDVEDQGGRDRRLVKHFKFKIEGMRSKPLRGGQYRIDVLRHSCGQLSPSSLQCLS